MFGKCVQACNRCGSDEVSTLLLLCHSDEATLLFFCLLPTPIANIDDVIMFEKAVKSRLYPDGLFLCSAFLNTFS